MTIAARLTELGIALPTPAKPVANYVPYVVTGNLVVVYNLGAASPGADAALMSGRAPTTLSCTTSEAWKTCPRARQPGGKSGHCARMRGGGAV